MSQKNVEILLGKILTDGSFREEFFPVASSSFELVESRGLELTAVEKQALALLSRRSFEHLARSLDSRICRSAPTDPAFDRGKWSS
jgi:hypothetical protein